MESHCSQSHGYQPTEQHKAGGSSGHSQLGEDCSESSMALLYLTCTECRVMRWCCQAPCLSCQGALGRSTWVDRPQYDDHVGPSNDDPLTVKD